MSLNWGVARDQAAPPRGAAPPVLPPDARGRFPETSPAADDGAAPRASWRVRAGRILLVIAVTPVILSALYAFVPPVSTLMLARWATFRSVERDWVPLADINPALPRAVIATEDGTFCSHWGVDWGAVRSVIEETSEDWPERGASTVSMQVVKNLFLWPGFGYVRKPIELVLAHWIELTWSKARIMEVYLNIAEWGPNGIFGAEAGARKAFGKSARNLTPREAAIMVAALPNPVIRNPARPTAGQIRRAARISARSAQGPDTTCLSRF